MADKPHKLFDRTGWSYMPANLEGCLVLGVFSVVMLAILGGGVLLSRALNSIILEIAMWVVLATAFFAFMRFCRRHS